MQENYKTSFWQPVWSMLKFTSNIIFKKPSTWIVFAVFSVMVLLLCLMPKFLSIGMPVYQAVSSTIIYGSIGIALASGIQGVLRGLNIFKDSQKQGVEIILVSKPISRNQVLLSRFIFLICFSLLIAITNVILTIIAMAIVGFNAYSNVLLIIFGTFGSSIISFLVMALIATTIAIFNFGRMSSILPIVILSFSAIISIVFSSMATLIAPTQLRNLSNQIVEKINKKIANNEVSYEYTDYDGQKYKIKSFVYDSYENLFELIKYEGNDYIVLSKYASLSVKCEGLDWYQSINISDETGDNAQLSTEILNEVKTFVASANLSASGLVAINYINPISAFTSIAGGTSGSSNLTMGMNDISYNFSLSNMKPSSPITINSNGYSETYNNVWTFTTSQADPSWGVSLIWLSIIVALSTVNIISYNRKDFR